MSVHPSPLRLERPNSCDRRMPSKNLVTRQKAALRSERVDALRTLAMVWMTVFHFCFDLNHLGMMAKQNFYADPFWTWQRTAIVSLFLFTAGISQALAIHQQGLAGVSPLARLDKRFWSRWLQVAGCAALVSAGSAVMFPASFIYFGVLHGLAVMLVIARLTAGWGKGLWWAGGAIVALFYVAPYLINQCAGCHFFNENSFNWLGLITRKPVTEDFVPVVPWLAALWWGMAAGQWVLVHRMAWLGGGGAPSDLPAAQAGPVKAGAHQTKGASHSWHDRLVSWLALPGRWSLSYYMLHQPVLIGSLLLWRWVQS